MDLSFVLNDTHTRAVSALGYNAGRRELMIGYEGTVNTQTHYSNHHFSWQPG